MNGNDPYNPVMHSDGTFKGVSIREQFAAMAMQAIISNSVYAQLIIDEVPPSESARFVSEMAVEQADALIKSLNETP